MSKVYIIAEAGVNHNGSVEIAKRLIEVASDSGADAVKFQTFKTENIVSQKAGKADYQKQTTDKHESQFDMIKKLELDYSAHQQLVDYSNTKGIEFLSTPFDLESIDLLVSLKIDKFKIPSGEITNLPYLEKIGKLGKQVILSTGMAYLGEIEAALEILIKNGTPRERITILHANTEYPTPMEDVNLRSMKTIGNAFDVKFGYSDHTLGIEVPIAAVAMGASVIEKHFTLDRKMDGPDHQASLEPKELKLMVQSIRNIEKALGTGIKWPSDSEKKNIHIARKSIHALINIKKGEKLMNNNITIKRPGTGISPMEFYHILGKIANRNIEEDTIINFGDFV